MELIWAVLSQRPSLRHSSSLHQINREIDVIVITFIISNDQSTFVFIVFACVPPPLVSTTTP
jgi:hypothetical protein